MRRAPRLIAAARCRLSAGPTPPAHRLAGRSGGFELSAATYTVHEYSGRAVITVVRGDARADGHVAYIAVGMGHPCGAPAVHGHAARQRRHPGRLRPHARVGWTSPPACARETLLGRRSPTTTSPPSTRPSRSACSPPIPWAAARARTRCCGSSATSRRPARDAAQPAGAGLGASGRRPAARRALLRRSRRRSGPRSGPPTRRCARSPTNPAWPASAPSAAPTSAWPSTATSSAPTPRARRRSRCWPPTSSSTATAAATPPVGGDVAHYRGFISRLAHAIGSHRAVLFLELDALITQRLPVARRASACASASCATRSTSCNAICPHLVIYLDAGAADAIGAQRTAADAAPLGRATAFRASCSTRPTSTGPRARSATASASPDLLGGAHFVINTGTNGRGPLVPSDRARQGNEVLCNPPGRGLGPRPTTDTGYRNVDAFEWTTNPGESGGACVPGAPPTGLLLAPIRAHARAQRRLPGRPRRRAARPGRVDR